MKEACQMAGRLTDHQATLALRGTPALLCARQFLARCQSETSSFLCKGTGEQCADDFAVHRSSPIDNCLCNKTCLDRSDLKSSPAASRPYPPESFRSYAIPRRPLCRERRTGKISGYSAYSILRACSTKIDRFCSAWFLLCARALFAAPCCRMTANRTYPARSLHVMGKAERETLSRSLGTALIRAVSSGFYRAFHNGDKAGGKIIFCMRGLQ